MKASHRGAFFVAALFLFAGALPAQAQLCPPDRIDESVEVAKVVDGDTLRLKDGRLVRLIGINTPELGRDGRPSEPLAALARDAVSQLLADKPRIGLRYGVERQDRHRRLLAHAYLATGQSVEAHLLSLGLAAFIVVPPNTWHASCYQMAEAQARQAKQGVWSALYRPIPVDKLPRNLRGFRVISGRIERVGESRDSLWLNFQRRPGEGQREGVALRIRRADLHYFTSWSPLQLQGKTIEVRGWLVPVKQQQIMSLRHPAAVRILPH